MERNATIWMAIAGVAAAVAAALALRRRGGGESKKEKGEATPIYTSGVFSLIRKSPREAVLARVPELESIRAAPAAGPEKANGTPERFRDEWLRVAELCINNVERGDKEGIQTYRYAVPEKCRATCGRFGGDAYVTREQLHHEVRLIPPFHLGCGCEITPREAGGAGGWSPILPVNGRYDTPDWRTVVRL